VIILFATDNIRCVNISFQFYFFSSSVRTHCKNVAASHSMALLVQPCCSNPETFCNTEQAVVRKHNKPRPRVVHRGIARFLGIDQKCNKVVPWSPLKISCKSVQPFAHNVDKC